MNQNLDNETQGEIVGDGESRALHAHPLQTQEHPMALTGAHKVVRRLNRDTTWLATALLGSVIFAALVLALQERHPKAADLTKEARQTGGNLLLNANSAELSKVVGSNGKSTGEITFGQATIVDHRFTPEINHPNVQANTTSWSPAHRQVSARLIRPKIPNVRYRSSVRPRIVDVKMRLIALWHHSLARTERSRS
jgi:hypothetical protein